MKEYTFFSTIDMYLMQKLKMFSFCYEIQPDLVITEQMSIKISRSGRPVRFGDLGTRNILIRFPVSDSRNSVIEICLCFVKNQK